MVKIIKFVIVPLRYKGAQMIVRRWLDGGKEEILINDNFAKLAGYPSKKAFISDLLKDVETDYQEGDGLWIEWDFETNKIKSFSISKLENKT